jgi:hypothetical protein
MLKKLPLLTAEIKRGANKHTILTPHPYRGGLFVVSQTRYEVDYTKVTESELMSYIKRGYSVRMSDPVTRRSPRLICPESIKVTLA